MWRKVKIKDVFPGGQNKFFISLGVKNKFSNKFQSYIQACILHDKPKSKQEENLTGLIKVQLSTIKWWSTLLGIVSLEEYMQI